MKKDINGNKIKVGTILLEIGRGGSFYKGKNLYSLKLWEFPKNYQGQGLEYGIDGSKSQWWWANASNSYILNTDEMPYGLIFSFYHGLSDIDSTLADGNPLDLILNSNYKDLLISENDINDYCQIRDTPLNSINDIKGILKLLKKTKYTPRKTINDVIKIAGASTCQVKNGESGIASMYDNFMYLEILSILIMTGQGE